MARVITSTGGYYDVQEVEFGRVYKWHPEIVTLECTCGQRSTLSGCVTDCEGCGANHAELIRERLGASRRLLEGEEIRPWRWARHGEEDGLPF